MSGIETKVAAGSVSFLAFGWLSTILIEAVPWLREHLTPDQKQNAPIVLAWLIGSLAAYFAPHTHRPDLPPLMPQANVPTITYTPPSAGPQNITTGHGRHEGMQP